jgi:EAL domain-containing protein (putative c-di-GMP-specific phosphodiesterase class I)
VNRTNLDRIVEDVLQETDLDPSYLDIELTETSVMTAKDESLPVLENLRSLGVTVALDDFGTGYSSLSHLQRLCIDKLKIDRSFLHDIPANRDNAAIVSAVIAMTRRLKLTVAAEGVETEEQLHFLRAEGCDLAQGFLFSRPLSPLAIEKMLLEKDAPIGAGSVDWTVAAAGSPGPLAARREGRRKGLNLYSVS